jgi:hypothetical protein
MFSLKTLEPCGIRTPEADAMSTAPRCQGKVAKVLERLLKDSYNTIVTTLNHGVIRSHDP